MDENFTDKAVQKLKAILGKDIVQIKNTPDQSTDDLLIMRVKKTEKRFQIELKLSINNATLALLNQQPTDEKQKTLLVTRYVSPPMAEKLKALGIQFLDTAGNAYLNFTRIFVFIKGNKPPATIQPETISRAFKPKGLQVIFALLTNKKLHNAPLRTVAEAANVSLGSVQWTVKDLQKLGYLKDMGKNGKKLIKKSELLNRWVQLYSEQLKPKLIIGKFNANEANWWQNTSITKFDAFWGGEVAGNRMTRNLKPEIITIYSHQPPGKLVIANKLRKDDSGNIEIVKTFWNPDFMEDSTETVHPLLVYTDLVSSGDERNLEIANQIYNEKIVGLIRED